MDTNPGTIYLSELSSSTRRTAQSSLKQAAKFFNQGEEYSDIREFPWHELRVEQLNDFHGFVVAQYKPAVARKMLSHLRRILSICQEHGLISEAYLEAIDQLDRVEGDSAPRGRCLSLQEIQALHVLCSNDISIFGIRDLAIIYLLRMGLRQNEIPLLVSSDFDGQSLRIPSTHKHKERVVYLSHDAIASLNNWINVRGNGERYLFCPLSRVGKVLSTRQLKEQTIRTLLLKRARLANVEPLSPHDFRRTFEASLEEAQSRTLMHFSL